MSELEILIGVVVFIFKMIFQLFKLIFISISFVVRLTYRLIRRAFRGPPEATRAEPQRMAAAKPAAGFAKRVESSVAARLSRQLSHLATRARALGKPCQAEPLCVPLGPSLQEFIVPRAEELIAHLRRRGAAAPLP